jgi:hypothetical protein
VGAAGARWVRDAELVRVEEESIRVVNLQDFLLPAQPVFLLGEGVDEAVTQCRRQGSMLALSGLDLVVADALVFLNLAVVFVL